MKNMSPDKPTLIRQMFSRIARRYDLMNRLMTLGRDQAWRRLAARELRLPTGGLCLDLATGTGDLALAVREAYPGAQVVGVDFSLAMMQVAQRKVGMKRMVGAAVVLPPHQNEQMPPPQSDELPPQEARIFFAAGDALRLPFADEQFDGLINGFLLRNVVDLAQALGEMRRAVKPGGRVVCLELTHPQAPVFRQLFHFYFNGVVPLIGGIVAGDRRAYSYLPNSLTAFPAAERLRQVMLATGFREVRYRRLMLGTVALHVATV